MERNITLITYIITVLVTIYFGMCAYDAAHKVVDNHMHQQQQISTILKQ
jgi:hypothetical protein